MDPVYIGTSGWSYKSWGNHFYPKEVPQNRQLEFYQTQFSTVEINNTFYRLATLNMTKRWHDVAPQSFLYAVKGSRFITHILRLANAGEGLKNFFERVDPLKEHFGPILWQLPPFQKKDLERLEGFLRLLPKKHRHAIEFRHPSWYEDDEVFQLLRKYNAAHVSLSSGRMPMNLEVTADFIYIRFHGLAGGAAHDYTRAELEPWAKHIAAHPNQEVFAYFNNDVNVRAPENARQLVEMVGPRALKLATPDFWSILRTCQMKPKRPAKSRAKKPARTKKTKKAGRVRFLVST